MIIGIADYYFFIYCRSGLDNTLPLLKDKACAALQENEAQNLSTTTDVDYHSVESFLKVSCPTKSKIKDCCSSVCSPCESPITRQRCLSSSEVPMLMEADHETSGDFLTLGISTRSYPISPQLGVEVNSKESMNHEDSHQVKRIKNFQDDALQLQMFNHREVKFPAFRSYLFIYLFCTFHNFAFIKNVREGFRDSCLGKHNAYYWARHFVWVAYPDLGIRIVASLREFSANVELSLLMEIMSCSLVVYHRFQESAPSVTDGIHSPCTDTSFFSAVGLSCRFTSTSSSNVSEVCLKLTGREEKRDFLDLNLKLAL